MMFVKHKEPCNSRSSKPSISQHPLLGELCSIPETTLTASNTHSCNDLTRYPQTSHTSQQSSLTQVLQYLVGFFLQIESVFEVRSLILYAVCVCVCDRTCGRNLTDTLLGLYRCLSIPAEDQGLEQPFDRKIRK